MYSLFNFFFLLQFFITMEKVKVVDLCQLHFSLIPVESLSKEFLDGHFDGGIFDLLSLQFSSHVNQAWTSFDHGSQRRHASAERAIVLIDYTYLFIW